MEARLRPGCRNSSLAWNTLSTSLPPRALRKVSLSQGHSSQVCWVLHFAFQSSCSHTVLFLTLRHMACVLEDKGGFSLWNLSGKWIGFREPKPPFSGPSPASGEQGTLHDLHACWTSVSWMIAEERTRVWRSDWIAFKSYSCQLFSLGSTFLHPELEPLQRYTQGAGGSVNVTGSTLSSTISFLSLPEAWNHENPLKHVLHTVR